MEQRKSPLGEVDGDHIKVKIKNGARVFLAIPFYHEFVGQCVDSYDNGMDPAGENQYVKFFSGCSFLANGFNVCWCNALNTRHRRWSHFAMIHADVSPRGYWLDRMIEEMRSSGAALLSVVLPIKSGHGLSSTAIREKATGKIRRLTMREVWREKCYRDYIDPDVPMPTNDHPNPIPTTFDGNQAAAALGLEGEWELLASTGLWIADFTKPWVDKVWFEVRDRILKRPDGKAYVQTVPEDWHFSSLLHQLGLRVCATKAVTAGHWGAVEFMNDVPFGSLEQDDRFLPFESWYDPPAASETMGDGWFAGDNEDGRHSVCDGPVIETSDKG